MGGSSSEFAAFVAEQLHPLGPLAINRFFGGVSIKSGATLFAMIMDGILYFAVDDVLRSEYEKLGSQCFSFASKKGRVDVKSFYGVPADFLEDQAQLVAFAGRSIIAADAKAAARKLATPKSKPTKQSNSREKI
jgi:DNA transformation protein and related proteins